MKQAISLLSLFVLLFTFNAKASHLAGGELRYEYNGTNYTFYLTMYSDCAGAGMTGSFIMTMQSTSLAVNSQVTMTQTSVSNVSLPCMGANTKCDSPPGNFPGFKKYTFSATATLAAAADWVFHVQECCHNASNNLAGTTSMYLGATLNNLAGVNSTAFVPTVTPAYITINSTNVSPLQYVDADGDSVVIAVSPVLITSGIPATYAVGRSATAPYMGGAYAVNSVNGTILQKAIMSGNTILAYTVYEYRSGNLISQYNREFISAAIAASGSPNYSYPFPQTPIQMAYACPGAAGSASASFIDSASTDSVFVSVDTPALAGWNFNVTTTKGTPTGSANITWTAPASLNPATLPHFYIKLKVWDNACPRGYNEYAIMVKTQQCPTDSVWPGDANDDNVANLIDVLAVGVAFGQTGPARPGATTTWTPQWSANWANNYPFTTTNVKHGDCNGDGTINLGDLGAIITNFGLTHPKGGPRSKTTGAPDFYFDVTNVVAAPGKTISVPVMLGNTSAALDNVYGMSAAVGVTGVTLPAPAALTTATSWLGNSSNTLEFSKDINNNTIMWAFSRTDHMNAKGNGQVATLSFTVPAGTPLGSKINLDMNDVTIIDNNGFPVSTPYNVLGAEMTVVASGIGNTNTALQSAAVIPNPSHGNAQLFIQLAQKEQLSISIADVTGKIIYNTTENLQQGSHYVTLPATLVSGMYTIQLSTASGAPQTLKWVNQ